MFACWAGTLIAYDSTTWAGGNGWPVSFCIVAVIFVLYFASGVVSRLRTDRRRRHQRCAHGCRAGRGGLMFASFMINAWEAATIVAIVAGVVGFFTVLRGAAFAAHSLPNGAFAGAAGAFLIGANTIVGLGVFSLAGAGMIAGLGRRARSDVATALTIVLMLALGDLFLSRTSEYAPEIFALLFGEVLGVSTSKLGPTVVIAAVCIVAVVVLYRPLMLSSVTPDVAEARGINPRVMDLAFLVVVALVTTMAVPVVGSLLIFSLLIGPPAAARSFTNRPPVAIGLVRAVRARHRVGRHRRLLRDEPTHRLLRRRHQRLRLHRRPGVDRGAANQAEPTTPRARSDRRRRQHRSPQAGLSHRMSHKAATKPTRPDGDTLRPDQRRGNGRPLVRTRNTPRKRALLEVLEAADGFLSAAELHDRLRALLAPQGLRVGITTVYHQLRALAGSGAVDTLRGDDGETRYWLPRRPSHHHYLVRRACGRALEIVADPVEEWADELGVTLGFRDLTHTFELFGLCDRCTDPIPVPTSQGHLGRRGSSRDQPAQSRRRRGPRDG